MLLFIFNSENTSICYISFQPLPQQFNSEKILNTFNEDVHKEHTESISIPRDRVLRPEREIVDSELESIFDTPKKSELRQQVRGYKMCFKNHRRQIKTLNQKVRRLKKRNVSLKNIVKHLKEKNVIDTDIFNMLDENIVAANLFNNIYKKNLGNKKMKYSAAIKRFSLTLNFYSPKAYDYVRKTFKTCLPHCKTLSKWYAHVKGEPGFTEEAFSAVKQKADASEYRPICALIFDEMALRQQKIWDGKKYQGVVDMGTGITTDPETVASQAFVFLLVAINQRWKIPLGYFLINSLTGEQKANLIKICLSKCFEAGVDVVSLTFDGHSTNFTAMEILSCDIKNLQSMKTTFKHPSNDTEVACFLDPCHVMKLIRNHLQSKKEFLDKNDNLIKWDYLVQLNILQDNEGLHLGNKLSKRHIAFQNQIMKVKLATQLLSRSVATALKICREDMHLHNFEQSKPSEHFIQTINDFFDIYNSRAMKAFGYKKPVNNRNKDEIFTFLDYLKKYITELKLKTYTKRSIMKDGKKTIVITRFYKPVVQTICKTGFLGILINIESLKYLFLHLIEKENRLIFLPTYKVSQDHLEIFFGSIRMHGGHNDNPNCKQFKGIYRKLLTHLELKCLTTGNCVPLENIAILNCTSATRVINSTAAYYRHDDENEEPSLNFLNSIDKNIANLARYLDVPDINDFRKYVVGYIAGGVAHYLLKKIKCEPCVSRLLSPERYDFHKLVTLRDKGGLSFPSLDTYNICCTCELVIRKIVKEGIIITSDTQHSYILSRIIKTFIGNYTIFSNLENEHNMYGIVHQTNLIRSVIEKYTNIRFHYIAQQETLLRNLDTKRQYYKKITQHKGN